MPVVAKVISDWGTRLKVAFVNAATARRRESFEFTEYSATVIPGYTHLQRGQPVTAGHHFLAYVEMLERDKSRLADARKRLNISPLGSGALAGSTINLDRRAIAAELGFDGVTHNSMDAIADRDYIAELLFVISLCGVHLSRLSEDLILWCTAEFAFASLSDAHTTGSSLMPQKKNPDVCELTRGKTGRLVGNLMNLLVAVKGLPLTYNRDLQEDKPALFDATRTLREFDDLITSRLHGYDGVDDYYTRASSKPHLVRIAVPTLLLNARNDPFLPGTTLPDPVQLSAAVTAAFPDQGGHVGFTDDKGTLTWMPQTVIEFVTL